MSRWHRNERRWLWKGTRTGWKRVAMKKRGRCLDAREKKRKKVLTPTNKFIKRPAAYLAKV